MSGFEYKVVPAPKRGLKAKGVKGNEARFANALQSLMNELGTQGWDYLRADTLPVEERQGLTGKTTSFQNMLVFRRALTDEVAEDVTAELSLIEDQSQEAPQESKNLVADPLALASAAAKDETGETPPVPAAEIAPEDTPQPRHAAE